MIALLVMRGRVKLKKVLKFLYFFVFSMMLFSTYAFAYLDPSTMTYAIQVVAGVFIAAGAFIGIYWHKIKRTLKGNKKKKKK